jgi:hypothetical protein
MKINYVVACYVGIRRNLVLDPYEYVLAHLKTLDEYQDENVYKITLVLNVDGDEGYDFFNHFNRLCQDRDYLKDRVDFVFRQNRGFSYASWEDAIIRNMGVADYFFLVEDDYLPGYKDYYRPFLEQLMNKNVGYCCSKVSHTHGRHAGMSSGMMRADVARAIYIERAATHYGVGEWSQVHFLDFMEQVGYTFNDPSHLVSTPFYDIHKNLIEYGNPDGPCPLKPILEVMK